MSHNQFGHLFRVTSWGESHGPAIGCVIDGCPPGIALSAKEDIQPFLDQRRPGSSRYVTQRRESDLVVIESGVVEGKTTGMPIALRIENVDARTKDYTEIADIFRPGHADYSWWVKYGLRDPRGGGRQSARETASRVAAGAVARKILHEFAIVIRGAMIQMGGYRIVRKRWDWDAVGQNPFFCPDLEMAPVWAEFLDKLRKQGSSIGAVLEIVASGVPAGIGAPVYGKLDADICAGLMSINAVKSVEIGAGIGAAELRGEENADAMILAEDGSCQFMGNAAGGILGGVSTGQEIIARFAVKPTSSIRIEQRTVDRFGQARSIQTKGRHDPCVGIRAVPVGEAMLACVLADHILRHRAQIGGFSRPWDQKEE